MPWGRTFTTPWSPCAPRCRRTTFWRRSRPSRRRPYRNAPRTLDLDILLYGDQVINTPTLLVPHPRLHERAFVLTPLAEIAPDRVPAHWLAAVKDQQIERLTRGWR